ncbi:hypothetical protein N7499_011606 [Penicillium canescens]|nr:hypothetical protein N7499_011606 [Penicillium canescens]
MAKVFNITFGIDIMSTNPDTVHHQKVRKNINSGLLKLRHNEDAIYKLCLDQIDPQLERMRANREDLDLPKYLSGSLWKILGHIIFGEPIGEEEKRQVDVLTPWFSTVAPYLEVITIFSAIPGVELIITRLMRLFASFTQFFDISQFNPYAGIQRHINNRDRTITSVANYMTSGVSENKSCREITEMELNINLCVFLLAAYETTSMALSSIFYFLLKDPIQLSKLRKELHASFEDVQAINDKELMQLPFLSGCINEALRLLPPVSGRFLARTSPGLYVDGIYVPKGIQMSVDIYTMHRSALYWTEPDRFWPERWSKALTNDNFDAFRPFSTGLSACPGSNLALRMTRLIVAKLTYRYSFAMVNKEFVWEKDALSSIMWAKYRLIASIKKDEEAAKT